MQNFDLTWVQRDHIATKLYTGDWRGAVALVPNEQKPALQIMSVKANSF
jgi:hypothetical protein